jgi:hypothetical protein
MIGCVSRALIKMKKSLRLCVETVVERTTLQLQNPDQRLQLLQLLLPQLSLTALGLREASQQMRRSLLQNFVCRFGVACWCVGQGRRYTKKQILPSTHQTTIVRMSGAALSSETVDVDCRTTEGNYHQAVKSTQIRPSVSGHSGRQHSCNSVGLR